MLCNKYLTLLPYLKKGDVFFYNLCFFQFLFCLLVEVNNSQDAFCNNMMLKEACHLSAFHKTYTSSSLFVLYAPI